MDASAPRDAPQPAPRQDHNSSPPPPAHPISRLEAEIERSEHPAGVPPQETERLLEETWTLLTECLVIRDGLLEACDEIGRTMGGLQRKLGALPTGIEPHAAAANGTGAPRANGALATAAGENGAPHANGSDNGAHPPANGATVNGQADGSSNGDADGSSGH